MKKYKNYWNLERCKEEALKYNKITDFYNNAKGAYTCAEKNNWIGVITTHMVKYTPPTKQECIKEALKYNKRSEFKNKSQKYYMNSKRNGWLEEVCSHMNTQKHEKWDIEKCKNIALEYDNKQDFKIYDTRAYKYACSVGKLEYICEHMIHLCEHKKRCIYVFEFDDNYAYVGLTCNYKKRTNEHLSNKRKQSAVYKHILTTSTVYKHHQLSEYVSEEEAIKLEHYYIEQYRDNGWIMLNKNVAGGLGSFTNKDKKIQIDKFTINKNSFIPISDNWVRYNNTTMWCDEEVNCLCNNHVGVPIKIISEYLNRSVSSVKQKLYELKRKNIIKRGDDKWSIEDTNYLLLNHVNKSIFMIAKELNRSESSVGGKIHRLIKDGKLERKYK